jgi:tetratricopeptide (TPR) repeat protein
MRHFFLIGLIIAMTTITFAQQVDNALLLDYYQSQKYSEAADYLKRAYAEPVTDLKVLSQLAYTSQMAGKLVDAEGYYQRILEKDSTITSVLYNLASINSRKGNSAKAVNYYKKIIQKDSTNFYVYKALANLSQGNTANMGPYVYYLQKANKLNAEDADVASDLSDFYVGLKQYAQAEKVLSAAIAIDPENNVLLQSLMKLTSGQGKHFETIKAGEKLMLLGDRSYFTLDRLGEAYYYTKNFPCGIETFAQLDQNLQNERTYYFVAQCFKSMKEHTKAIKYFQSAIDDGISKSIDAYYTEIADSYETLKKPKNALANYQKALQFDEKPMTFYTLASLFDKMEDKKSAVKYYKKYLAAKPPVQQQSYVKWTKDRINVLSR